MTVMILQHPRMCNTKRAIGIENGSVIGTTNAKPAEHVRVYRQKVLHLHIGGRVFASGGATFGL